MLINVPRLELKDEPSPFQNREARLQKQFNWDALRGWGGAYSDWLYQTMADFDQRFDDQINLTPQPSEIIDARDSTIYGKFPTLDRRLENIERMLSMEFPAGYLVTINHNLGRNPYVTVSYYEDAIGTETGGLGKTSIFGGTKAKFLESTTSYVDANTVKIELPAGFALAGYPVYQPADRCWYIIDGNRILKFDLGVKEPDRPNTGDQSEL